MAPPNSAVALLFVFAVVLAATLQPSDAIRVQVSNPADQEPASGGVAVQPSTWPGFPNIPGFPPLFPGFRPLPPLPNFPPLFPGFPPLPPLPSFPPLPGCPPLPPLPGLPIPPPQSGSPSSRGSPLPPPLPAASPPSSAANSPPSASLPGTPSSPATNPPPPNPPVSPSTPATSPTPSPSQPTECLSSLMGLMPCMGYLTNTTVVTPPTTCCDGFKYLVNDVPICLCHGMNGDINKLMPAPMDFTRMMSLPTSCGAPLPLQTLAQCSTRPVPPLMPPATPAPKPSQ